MQMKSFHFDKSFLQSAIIRHLIGGHNLVVQALEQMLLVPGATLKCTGQISSKYSSGPNNRPLLIILQAEIKSEVQAL